jgi:hypothetical protein
MVNDIDNLQRQDGGFSRAALRDKQHVMRIIKRIVFRWRASTSRPFGGSPARRSE